MKPFGKNKNCSLRFYILNLLSGNRLWSHLGAAGLMIRLAYEDVNKMLLDETAVEEMTDEELLRHYRLFVRVTEYKLRKARNDIHSLWYM